MPTANASITPPQKRAQAVVKPFVFVMRQVAEQHDTITDASVDQTLSLQALCLLQQTQLQKY